MEHEMEVGVIRWLIRIVFLNLRGPFFGVLVI